MLRRSATAILVLTFVGVACSSDTPEPARPSSAFGDPGSALPVDPGDTNDDAPVADDPAAASSTARIEVRGDVREDLTLDLGGQASATPPPGVLSLAWIDERGDILSVAGQSFTGTRDTDPTTVLTIVLVDGRSVRTFLTIDGECTVTIDRLDGALVRGSFTCRDLRAGAGGAIDAAGVFSATL